METPWRTWCAQHLEGSNETLPAGAVGAEKQRSTWNLSAEDSFGRLTCRNRGAAVQTTRSWTWQPWVGVDKADWDQGCPSGLPFWF